LFKNDNKGDNTMNLNPLASNMTELELADWRILFSYRTPVAAQNQHTKEYYKTQTKWSATTTRHINKWIPSDGVRTVVFVNPQEFFDNLIKEA
jgi:hypothetical protein